jgi:hypothetical protein
MSGVLARAAELLVAPTAAESVEPDALPPSVRAVVLGSPAEVVPLGAALALSLRAADRAAAAIVAEWRDGGGADVAASAATRAAARLAARLAARELVAVPRGRLVRLSLPADPSEAVAAVRRASAVVDAPFVTALGGARADALEELVAEHDLAVVAADPQSALARAALARLAARGIAASACPPLRRGLPRALALAGLSAPGIEPLRGGR